MAFLGKILKCLKEFLRNLRKYYCSNKSLDSIPLHFLDGFQENSLMESLEKPREIFLLKQLVKFIELYISWYKSQMNSGNTPGKYFIIIFLIHQGKLMKKTHLKHLVRSLKNHRISLFRNSRKSPRRMSKCLKDMQEGFFIREIFIRLFYRFFRDLA